MATINPRAVWSTRRRIDFDDLQGNTGETLLVWEGRVSEPEALVMRFDAEQSVYLPGTFHDHENASLVLGLCEHRVWCCYLEEDNTMPLY